MNKKRNLALPIGIVIAILAIGVLLGYYYLAPSKYFSIDVNPSIELQMNRLNQVTSINTINEHAEQLMAGYELTDKNLETVIEDIVDRMILNGYLADDKDNQILITSESNQDATLLLEKANTILSSYLEERQLNASVLQQSIEYDTQSMETAHENNVSLGKMAMIQKLIEKNNSLTVGDLSTYRISDLVALAQENNVELTGLETVNVDEKDSQNVGIIEDQKDNENDIDEEDQKDSENDSDKEDQKDNEKDFDKEDQKDHEKDFDKEDQQDHEKDVDKEDQQDSEKDFDEEDQQDSEKDFDKEDQQDHEKDFDKEDQQDSENDFDKEDQQDRENDVDKEDQQDNDAEEEDQQDNQNDIDEEDQQDDEKYSNDDSQKTDNHDQEQESEHSYED